MLSWPTKDPDEILDYQWQPPLDSGDTVSSAALTLVSGTVSINTQGLAANMVTIVLSGGAVGRCLFRGDATTAAGRTVQEFIVLDIAAKPFNDAFKTKGALSDAIAAWLNRDDLATRIPDFIRLAEARMNRLLRDPDQIVQTTVTVTSGDGDLPADFGQMIAFGPAGTRLTQVTPGEFGTYNSRAGNMQVFAVVGTRLKTLPTSSGPVPIAYYRTITPLVADGDTNWLLTRAPDLYLWGSLLQAEFYGWNDERLPLIRNGWDDGIAELRIDGEARRWGSAPLSPKIGRS